MTEVLVDWSVVCEEQMRKALVDVALSAREYLKPEPDMKPSEWAEAYRFLPETAAVSGRWKNAEMPHLVEIMDSIHRPGVRRVTFMKSSQVGGTEVINNMLGWLIDMNPCSIQLMQPAEADAADYADQKFDEMVRSTERLRKKMPVSRRKNVKSQSKLRRRFPGGFLNIVSGTTVRSTRQRSIRVTIADDIDGIEKTKEGDPIKRLMKRSTTYPDAFHFEVSTPTLKGSSRIESEYEKGSKGKWYCTCPACGGEAVLNWANLTWEKDVDAFGKVTKHYTDTVKYACGMCGVLLNEAQRQEMLQGGRWIHERPWNATHLSYWINELSSRRSTMQQVAQQIVDAGTDEKNLEVLYNTVFGEPFEAVRGEEIDALQLMERVIDEPVHPQRLGNWILFLTASVDVQGGNVDRKESRLEARVYGWGYGEERQLIYSKTIFGNVKDARGPWKELDMLWMEQFIRQDGMQVKLRRIFIDAGYESQTVYDYVRGRVGEGIFAIKGSNRLTAEVIPRSFSMVDKGRVALVVVGTQMVKYELFSSMRRVTEQGPKYTRFPKAYCNSEFFKQLTSEVLVESGPGIFSQRYWKKKNKNMPNEELDLYVYAYAAMRHCAPNWERLKARDEKERVRLQDAGELAASQEAAPNAVATVTDSAAKTARAALEKREETKAVKRDMRRGPVSGSFVNSWRIR